MTKQDEETVRAGLAALNRRDVDGMLATLHPDAELIPLKAVVEGSVYRGHEGLRRWLAEMYEDWDDLRIDVEDVRGLADARVLVLARFHALGRSSGVLLDQPAAWICRMRDGQVAQLRFYPDAQAAEAAA